MGIIKNVDNIYKRKKKVIRAANFDEILILKKNICKISKHVTIFYDLHSPASKYFLKLILINKKNNTFLTFS